MPIPESEAIDEILARLLIDPAEYSTPVDRTKASSTLLSPAEARTALMKLLREARIAELNNLPHEKMMDIWGQPQAVVSRSFISDRITTLRKENGSDE